MGNRKIQSWCVLTVSLLTSGVCRGEVTPEIAQAIQSIRAVGPEGQGNAEASVAWKKLAAVEVGLVPGILEGMDGANDLAANWLRTALESIVAREEAAGRKPSLTELGRFLLDTRHDPSARRFAFELIGRADRAAADSLLPGMLNDPNGELRRDAVQKVLDQAARSQADGRQAGAVLLYQQALIFARDVDQIEIIVKKLRDLGQTVDLPRVFGWLMSWKVIAPFDSVGGKGFEAVYPPEKEINLSTEYEGKSGKVSWKDLVTADEYGVVDLNKPYGALKGVAGYTFTEFNVERAQAVELRLASQNSWKIWLNGKFLFGREEYHRNREIDQYRVPATLQPGRNTLLVKVCQNEQKDDWAGEWQFQLRVCDPLGTPVALVAGDRSNRGDRAQAPAGNAKVSP